MEHQPPTGRIIFDYIEDVSMSSKYGRFEIVLHVHEHKNSALQTSYINGSRTGKSKKKTKREFSSWKHGEELGEVEEERHSSSRRKSGSKRNSRGRPGGGVEEEVLHETVPRFQLTGLPKRHERAKLMGV